MPTPGLALCGRTLLSTGDDETIGVWGLGTWSHLTMGRVSEQVPRARYCYCLTVRGSMRLCDGLCKDDESGFVVVLDTDTSDGTFQVVGTAKRLRDQLESCMPFGVQGAKWT